MIQLLKWLGIVALIATLSIGMIYGNAFTLQYYIAIFFGIVILGWLSSFIYARKEFFQVIYLVELVLFFLWELTLASFQVAYEVIKPAHDMQPGIVAIPLDVKTDLGITIFSALVTLTPGSLSLDVSADKSHLFIHAMYIDQGDIEALVNELKNGFERRIIRVLE